MISDAGFLVLWFADGVWQSPLAAPPKRPWYRKKQGLCFADILRCAQRVMPALAEMLS